MSSKVDPCHSDDEGDCARCDPAILPSYQCIYTCDSTNTQCKRNGTYLLIDNSYFMKLNFETLSQNKAEATNVYCKQHSKLVEGIIKVANVTSSQRNTDRKLSEAKVSRETNREDPCSSEDEGDCSRCQSGKIAGNTCKVTCASTGNQCARKGSYMIENVNNSLEIVKLDENTLGSDFVNVYAKYCKQHAKIDLTKQKLIDSFPRFVSTELDCVRPLTTATAEKTDAAFVKFVDNLRKMLASPHRKELLSSLQQNHFPSIPDLDVSLDEEKTTSDRMSMMKTMISRIRASKTAFLDFRRDYLSLQEKCLFSNENPIESATRTNTADPNEMIIHNFLEELGISDLVIEMDILCPGKGWIPKTRNISNSLHVHPEDCKSLVNRQCRSESLIEAETDESYVNVNMKSSCGLQDTKGRTTQRSRIEFTGEIAVIHISRNQSNNDKVNILDSMTLDPLYVEGKREMRLTSILCYTGAHYYMYFRNINTNQWFRVSDTNVDPVDDFNYEFAKTDFMTQVIDLFYHTTENYESYKPYFLFNLVGLVNNSNFCWANAAFQCLLRLPAVVRRVTFSPVRVPKVIVYSPTWLENLLAVYKQLRHTVTDTPVDIQTCIDLIRYPTQPLTTKTKHRDLLSILEGKNPTVLGRNVINSMKKICSS